MAYLSMHTVVMRYLYCTFCTDLNGPVCLDVCRARGTWRVGCICPMIYAPQCDTTTNTTYSNACEAGCNGIKDDVLAPGPCPKEPCTCPADEPKVGTDVLRVLMCPTQSVSSSRGVSIMY